MLVYLANGIRHYHKHFVPLRKRGRWEFEIVIHGRIAMVHSSGPDILKQRRLWLSAPNHWHGWIGEPDQTAHVIIFQFPYVPDTLTRLFPDREGVIDIPLTANQCHRIKCLADHAQQYWHYPKAGRMVCYEHILMELSLLVIESISLSLPGAGTDFNVAKTRVDRAIKWFTDHMHENPGFEKVACETGVSTAQLRRDFHYYLEGAPKEIFSEIRLKRAIELIDQGKLKLEAIAEHCGFGGASSFSRAFKAKFGISPRSWEYRSRLRIKSKK